MSSWDFVIASSMSFVAILNTCFLSVLLCGLSNVLIEVMNRFSKQELMCEEMRYVFSAFLVRMQTVF